MSLVKVLYDRDPNIGLGLSNEKNNGEIFKHPELNDPQGSLLFHKDAVFNHERIYALSIYELSSSTVFLEKEFILNYPNNDKIFIYPIKAIVTSTDVVDLNNVVNRLKKQGFNEYNGGSS